MRFQPKHVHFDQFADQVLVSPKLGGRDADLSDHSAKPSDDACESASRPVPSPLHVRSDFQRFVRHHLRFLL
jgi:hypothetical protein